MNILSSTENVMLAAKIFGYMGAVLASVFLIPQVYKVIKTKIIKDVSMLMTGIIIIGTVIWLTYGILLAIGNSDWVVMLPVIISNVAQLVCSTILIVLKIIYINKKEKKEGE